MSETEAMAPPSFPSSDRTPDRLLYSSVLRLLEALRLRVKDLDLISKYPSCAASFIYEAARRGRNPAYEAPP